MYRVTIYVPDRHLLYDSRTPDRQGVGGGVTARLRLAQALAALGHQVTLVANLPRSETLGGVNYRPLDQVERIETDVLVLSSSGGALDLRPVLDLSVQSRWREVWVHGTAPVKGMQEVGYDYVVAVSNFIRRTVSQEWGVPVGKIFVAYNAVVGPGGPAPFSGQGRRDPYRLIYSGHPSKGLEAALGVVRLLRAQNPRFELHIYGGNRLWGEKEANFASEAGVFYHGLLGQSRLAQELQRSSFSLHLQAIQEGFGLGLIEALAAGCIVLASPVGAIVELVRSGSNGFLIPGDHLSSATWERVTELILQMVRAPDFAAYIRHQARNLPWTWERMARVWTQHWDWVLEQKGELARNAAGSCACPECGAAWLLMADGYHCTGCGMYSGSPEPFQLSKTGQG